MSLPFTPEQFFDVFRRYNDAVWPLQLLLSASGVAALQLCLVPGRPTGLIISRILALLWQWMGAIYHLVFFLPINPAAALFGSLFLAAAALFAWEGVIHDRLQFRFSFDARGAAVLALAVYAFALYPGLRYLFGRDPTEAVSLGLPCPTTIFTIAMLGLLKRPLRRIVFVVPLLWAVVGAQAAWLFGVYEDLALIIAAGFGLWVLLEPGEIRGMDAEEILNDRADWALGA
jgi:hypothetical protein